MRPAAIDAAAAGPEPAAKRRAGRSTGAVLALMLLCWAGVAWLALDMEHPLAQLAMPMSAHWSMGNALAVLAMWTVMMAAMMLPSAWPMARTFVGLCQRSGEDARGWGFIGAYLLVWAGFSIVATGLQWALQAAGQTNAMVASRSAALTGLLLLVSGLYQFSPLKRLCLARCRSPIGFLLGEWRPGARGGFTMGLRHGAACVGCCWAMMALLFVGGAMNLAWIAALAVAVAIEKLVPGGDRVATLLGVGLIAAGAWRLVGLLA